jgi:hypothetical protein
MTPEAEELRTLKAEVKAKEVVERNGWLLDKTTSYMIIRRSTQRPVAVFFTPEGIVDWCERQSDEEL